MSALIGGTFMVLCDLAARTVMAPNELPVGVVTTLSVSAISLNFGGKFIKNLHIDSEPVSLRNITLLSGCLSFIRRTGISPPTA